MFGYVIAGVLGAVVMLVLLKGPALISAGKSMLTGMGKAGQEVGDAAKKAADEVKK